MATRANVDLTLSLLKSYQVKNTVSLALGNRVKFGTADTEVDLAGAAEPNSWGTVVGFPQAPGTTNQVPANGTNGSNMPTSVTGDGTDKFQVTVALDGNAIVSVIVGTGGSTRGLPQVLAANGVTDGPAAPVGSDGTVVHKFEGRAMQTGVAGDAIGMLVPGGYYIAAT